MFAQVDEAEAVRLFGVDLGEFGDLVRVASG